MWPKWTVALFEWMNDDGIHSIEEEKKIVFIWINKFLITCGLNENESVKIRRRIFECKLKIKNFKLISWSLLDHRWIWWSSHHMNKLQMNGEFSSMSDMETPGNSRNNDGFSSVVFVSSNLGGFSWVSVDIWMEFDKETYASRGWFIRRECGLWNVQKKVVVETRLLC